MTSSGGEFHALTPRAVLRGLLLSGVAALFLLLGNLAWERVDRSIPVADEAHHLLLSFDALELFSRLPASWAFFRLPELDRGYPPLGHLAGALAMHWVGPSRTAGFLANTAFAFVALLGCYLLATRLGGPGAGGVAVLLLALTPAFYGETRTFMLELPVAAVTAIAILALELGEGFQSLGWSMAFGLSCGLGLLTKYSFPVYLSGPLAVAVIETVRHPQARWRRIGLACANGFVALLLAAIVGLPWYLARWPERYSWLTSTSTLVWQPYDSSWHTLPGLGFYLLGLLSFPGMPGVVALWLLGFGLLAVKRPWFAARAALWIGLPWALLTASSIKWTEYFTPGLIALTAAAAAGLCRGPAEPRAWWRGPRPYWAGLVITALGVWLYGLVNFGIDRQLAPGETHGPFVEKCLLGPGRWISAHLLGVPAGGDISYFKGDLFGLEKVSYPAKHVLTAIKPWDFGGLTGVHAQSILEIDTEGLRWAAASLDCRQRFVDLHETDFYRPVALRFLIIHLPTDEVPDELSLRALVNNYDLDLSPPEFDWGGSGIRFSRIYSGPLPGAFVHVFRRID